MSLISASKISKYYGISPVIEEASFHINKGDKIGIVGANGAGKSTLINILAGELDADSGKLFFGKQASIGYLKQSAQFQSGGNVMEELLKKKDSFRLPEGADPEKWAKGILSSLSFGEDCLSTQIDILSGGEHTRLALAAMLLESPDIMMLDEPTNHLDIGSLKWVEQYLKNYKGTLIVISHDRYFLDKLACRIFEIENHRLKSYDGNYSSYLEKKRKDHDIALRHYEKQQEEIKRQEAMIRTMKAHNTEHLVKRAQSREKRLQMVKRLERPQEYRQKIKLNFREALQTGNDVLYAEGLSKSFGSRRLFENVALDIKRGDRICIVGPNGTGKTTLLKILLGQERADSGMFRLGQNVMPAYYDQQQEFLHPDKTVLDELHSLYIKYDQTELRALLGRFLFTGESVFKRVGDLSGGEKARLSMLELMMSNANLLIMDEPTNHLDINAMEVIEDALLSFPGTMIIVSHDRYLLKKIPTAILELGQDGITSYLGNYDYYEQKASSVGSAKTYIKTLGAGSPAEHNESVTGGEASKDPEWNVISGTAPQELGSKQERERRKAEAAAEKRAAKAAERLEEDIKELELEIARLEDELCKPEIYSDPARSTELSAALENAKELVDLKYLEWYNN